MFRPHVRFTLVLALAASAASTSSLNAADWTRFRGPNGTGISADKDIPVEWDGAAAALWKTAIPGQGNASPVVSQQRVFLQTASNDGSQRALLCLNLQNGKVIWEKSAPGNSAKTHTKNTLASCTVATDGTRVFTPFWDGAKLAVTAFDFDGKTIWTRDLGTFTSQHGAGHSPLLVGDRVIVANDQDGVSTLVALDAASGKVLWNTTRPARKSCYSTPFLLERPGGAVEIVVANTTGLGGYDPQTGREVWKWDWNDNPLRTVASPVFSQGMVFITGGDGAGNRHAVAVRVDGGPVTDASLVWENRRTFPYVPCMLAAGDYLYFVNDRGVAACHVAKTGENVWTERLGGNFTSSPILVDGKVYAANEEGEVFVFPAEPTFQLLAKNEVGERIYASPAVADGRLLIRGKDHLFCFGKRDVKTTAR